MSNQVKTLAQRSTAMDKISALVKEIHGLAQENEISIHILAGAVVQDDEGDATRQVIECTHVDGRSVKAMYEAELEASGGDVTKAETVREFAQDILTKISLVDDFNDLVSAATPYVHTGLMNFLLRDELRSAASALTMGKALWLDANGELEKVTRMQAANPKLAVMMERMKEKGGGRMYRALRDSTLTEHLNVGMIQCVKQLGESLVCAATAADNKLDEAAEECEGERRFNA